MKLGNKETIYSDIDANMKRIKVQNERYENATPDYKVLYGIFNNLSNAFYAIKYKEKGKEDILIELAEARGKVSTLMIKELHKTKNKNEEVKNEITQ